ncbi:hypothetical protein [Actinoplanes sp. NPDC049265]|uniref:hypothetical protein n=1 Tax=Actinoplanes sp. NPDC049265 TaxID=3363902 RepID=UPI003721C33B
MLINFGQSDGCVTLSGVHGRWVRSILLLLLIEFIAFIVAWAAVVIFKPQFAEGMNYIGGGLSALAGIASCAVAVIVVRRRDKKAERPPWPIWLLVGALVAFLGPVNFAVAGRISAPAVAAPAPAPAAPPAATISVPVGGSAVGRCETVRGQLSPASRQRNIWILVQARGEALYLSGQVNAGADGRFENRVEIGGDKGAGVPFAVSIVQTDAALSRNFGDRWTANGKGARSTDLGLPLPDGAERLAQVDVVRTRDESCRGR